MKRILTIQDISCVGRCSITVALPIISAMGVETVILPTAVLSTHSIFPNFTCKDLEDQIQPITDHWLSQQVSFDAIYTGYLATSGQIALVKEVFEKFRTDKNLIIVDPAMADHGRLYPAFDMEFTKHMKYLCSCADIILPNITEAAFMTGMEYKEEYDEFYIQELMIKLSLLGAKVSILTGVSFDEEHIGVYGYDKVHEEWYSYTTKKIGATYHGTGDIFASTFTGAIMNGRSWKEAIIIAAKYTSKCIEANLKEPEDACWYGVKFEKEIPYLVELLNTKKE